MSNPRPDPPRLAAIRELQRGWQAQSGIFRYPTEKAIDALLAERDALLADLRTLEAQWRKKAEVIQAEREMDAYYTYLEVADQLAALLARLEGTTS